jgi:hypothetical protein
MKRTWLTVVLAAALATIPLAQMRVTPLDDEQGHVALGLVLRHLANAGIYMMATAHPDDENNGLLVLLNRGHGLRTALATATRGNGGQNEIGPELFEPLGVLRTEELAALQIDSSVARTRCPRVVPRVIPTSVPRAYGSQ